MKYEKPELTVLGTALNAIQTMTKGMGKKDSPRNSRRRPRTRLTNNSNIWFVVRAGLYKIDRNSQLSKTVSCPNATRNNPKLEERRSTYEIRKART